MPRKSIVSAFLILGQALALSGCQAGVFNGSSNVTAQVQESVAVSLPGQFSLLSNNGDSPTLNRLDSLLERVKNKPFSYEIRPLKADLKANEACLAIEGELATVEYPDDVILQFTSESTASDVKRFLQDFQATVNERFIIPGTEDNSVSPRMTNRYRIHFSTKNVKLDKLVELANRANMHGTYQYSSEKHAKVWQEILRARLEKEKYNIEFIEPNSVLDINQASTTREGKLNGVYQYSPTSAPFWFQDTWNPASGKYGNKINGLNESAFHNNSYHGAGVKVAVIDRDFFEPGESINS